MYIKKSLLQYSVHTYIKNQPTLVFLISSNMLYLTINIMNNYLIKVIKVAYIFNDTL